MDLVVEASLKDQATVGFLSLPDVGVHQTGSLLILGKTNY